MSFLIASIAQTSVIFYCVFSEAHINHDEKTVQKKDTIEMLEAQKQKLLHPLTAKIVMDKAKEAGLTLEEIAEKLGLEI